MTDWETRSMKFVVAAIDSAQKRQQKLWKQIIATRTRTGLVRINWPAIEEFIESVRRAHALMIDLETVAGEYEQATGSFARKKKRKAPAARKRARKKAGKKR